VLEVKSWPANTRLAKAVAQSGLPIECKVPAAPRLLKWLTRWAKDRHQVRLDRADAEMMVDIVGPEPGLLEQELAKLAAVVGPGGEVGTQMIHDLVGGWRTKTTWEMIDAMLAGDAPAALAQLDQLLLGGEHPVALMGQVSWSLRAFAAATRLIEQAERAGRRLPLRVALEQAGVKPFRLAQSESSLRRIGRERGGRLYRLLLETDLALKGANSSPTRARIVVEQLICRLGGPAAVAR
jgi:DNA polymerase-3 subunit delta